MLKDLLTSAPVLTYPRVEDPFILETDASILGLGAILSQCWPNPPFNVCQSLTQPSRAKLWNHGLSQ